MGHNSYKGPTIRLANGIYRIRKWQGRRGTRGQSAFSWSQCPCSSAPSIFPYWQGLHKCSIFKFPAFLGFTLLVLNRPWPIFCFYPSSPQFLYNKGLRLDLHLTGCQNVSPNIPCGDITFCDNFLIATQSPHPFPKSPIVKIRYYTVAQTFQLNFSLIKFCKDLNVIFLTHLPNLLKNPPIWITSVGIGVGFSFLKCFQHLRGCYLVFFSCLCTERYQAWSWLWEPLALSSISCFGHLCAPQIKGRQTCHSCTKIPRHLLVLSLVSRVYFFTGLKIAVIFKNTS